MAKKSGLADVLWGLPWILKLLVAIFFDVVFGVCRFVDGILQGDIIKIIIGFFWIFYGLGIGWIIDIICVALNIRPFFF
ncbi:MAG: hypothetical protein IKD43_03190 [Clostridia bacterium]|nr:hypothetical protein [Clostridia bacterium]